MVLIQSSESKEMARNIRENDRVKYEAVLTEKEAVRYKHVPDKYKLNWLRALNGKLTRSQSIKLKCADCNGFEKPIQRTRDCQVKTCPIWHYRPYQPKD